MKCEHGFEHCGLCHAKSGALWPDTQPPGAELYSRAQVDEMAMLIRRLARAVKKANPSSDLPEKAMDYLTRHGLQGSPLR